MSQSLKDLLPGIIKCHFQRVLHVWHLEDQSIHNSNVRGNKLNQVASAPLPLNQKLMDVIDAGIRNLSGPELLVYHAPLP